MRETKCFQYSGTLVWPGAARQAHTASPRGEMQEPCRFEPGAASSASAALAAAGTSLHAHENHTTSRPGSYAIGTLHIRYAGPHSPFSVQSTSKQFLCVALDAVRRDSNMRRGHDPTGATRMT